MIRKLVKSMSYAFVAQVVSLLVSMFMSFFVSRFMLVSDYGYYQLFLFYSTYVSLLQFGASEGVYLENGGKRYDQLDYPMLKKLFLNVLAVDSMMLLVIGTLYTRLSGDIAKSFIIVLICLYAIANFFVTYFGMLLQTVNRTEDYSKAIIIGKLVTLVLFIALVTAGNYQHVWYCVIFLLGHILSGIIVTVECREIIGYRAKWEMVLVKQKRTLVAGMSLLLSGLVSAFIIGVSRIYIEWYLGIQSFAKVSMALSLINFFILFAIQVGIVVFPRLASADNAQKIQFYRLTDRYISFLMPLILVAYIPLRFILSNWIPQYRESISWMLLFLPYMVFEIRTQIIYNTYFKALRKERLLLLTNLVALAVSAIVNFILIHISDNLELLFYVINLVMIFKSLVLSRTIEREYDMPFTGRLLVESTLCCVSALICYKDTSNLVILLVALAYMCVFGLYTLIGRKREV